MSCILRVSGKQLEEFISRMTMQPFRVAADTLHFEVSTSGFDDFLAQINDAVAFLRSHAADLKLLLAGQYASGVLDFAIEWRNVAAQFDTFPSELVREAGKLGL